MKTNRTVTIEKKSKGKDKKFPYIPVRNKTFADKIF